MIRPEDPSFRDYTKLCCRGDLRRMLKALEGEAAFDMRADGEWYAPYDLFIRVVKDQLAVLEELSPGSPSVLARDEAP
jgi:hypothetical protein